MKRILCNNRTKTVGSERELRKFKKQIDFQKLMNHLILQDIKQKFNPFNSPWMGGICEILVKYIKRAVRVIYRDRAFTKDSFLYLPMKCRIDIEQETFSFHRWQRSRH